MAEFPSATPLGPDATVRDHENQAEQLLAALRAGNATAVRIFHQCHPRFLDPEVTWLPRPVGDDEIRAAGLDLDDARLAVARAACYRDWPALVDHVTEIGRPDSPVRAFELAVEALIRGDRTALEAMLRRDPELVRARSVRVTCFDPAVHRATLLHYLGANGVEGHRQRSPANAVEMAELVLDAGAEVDALAAMYGGEYATLSMLVSSSPPADAGVQGGLVEVLLDRGAAIEGVGSEEWKSPLMTALVFGFRDVAAILVRRGARADHLVAAAGLGRVEATAALLPGADPGARHRALALAAQLGHAEAVRLLLDAGEDPDRFNPPGFHAHATPLHQAALAGHEAVVRLLIERGARLDLADTLWHATPVGWARHQGQEAIARILEAAS